MNFDSHTSGVVAKAVEAVNTLTPGHVQGREYPTPDLRAFDPDASLDDLRELSTYAVELRAVFESADIDEACTRVNALLRETAAAPVLIRHDGEPW
ncbi:CGNR zinc finger domain-containing protein, partial [Kibdelosporangium lantanae]